MILMIHMRGGTVIDIDVHSYEIEMNEFGTFIKNLKLVMYEDSKARLEYINEAQIQAIVAVQVEPRQPESN